MARLYSNENMPLPVVNWLRRLGHDVETSMGAGHAGLAISDESVLDHAVSEGRSVVTLNRRHFVKLHAERPDHRGIIVCSLDADFEGLARRIDAEISRCGPLEGVLIRVNRPG